MLQKVSDFIDRGVQQFAGSDASRFERHINVSPSTDRVGPLESFAGPWID